MSAGLLAKGLPGLRPCTPAGVIELLRRHDVDLVGAEAVVVGRSDLVGKPVAALLLARARDGHDLPLAHARPRRAVCRRADILVAAVGRPQMIKGDWIKPGAAVIDVGINRTDEGLVGDVEFESAVEVAGLITPVPGRRRADDDRDAAAQHARGGPGAGNRARPGLTPGGAAFTLARAS